MRGGLIGMWLVLIAAGAGAGEAGQARGETVPEARAGTAADSQVVELPASTEEVTDAEIRQIEKTVSGGKDIEEFKPSRPLSADKAIALPSDI